MITLEQQKLLDLNISIIVARSKNGVIGQNGSLPWHLPEDLKHFRSVTGTNPVVMGRKTFESLPERFKPLPGRTNIVLTHDTTWTHPGVLTFNDFESLELYILSNKEVEFFCIGGKSLYKWAIKKSKKLYITEIDEIISGDVKFPRFDKSNWWVEPLGYSDFPKKLTWVCYWNKKVYQEMPESLY